MEKNGKIVLTPEELKDIREGTLPKRVAEQWGLTIQEARDMVNQGCYSLK